MGAESPAASSADQAREILQEIFSTMDHGFTIRLWDGSEFTVGSAVEPVVFDFLSPQALKRILLNPTAAEFGEAYCDGDIDLQGDLFDVMKVADSMEEVEFSFWNKVKIAMRVKRIPK